MGVRIDEGRVKVQQFMIRQSEAGMLLCLCSKNNEADVFEVFDQRVEMLLNREHIVSYRINWNPKSHNIKSLAKELNIGLDSFIFLDDNPLECAEVQASCPEVLTVRLPEDATAVSTFLDHLWILDSIGQSREARRRSDLYKNNAQRDRLRNESLTFKEFLDSLDLEVEIAALHRMIFRELPNLPNAQINSTSPLSDGRNPKFEIYAGQAALNASSYAPEIVSETMDWSG